MRIPKTYCPLPWIHLCCNPSGRLCLCCEDTLESNFSNQKEYYIYNDIEDYYESPYMKWVKDRMLMGLEIKECSVCYNEEVQGLKSKRQHELEKWGFIENKSETLYLDLKFGNMCNLKCFMCDPNSSNLIANEFISLGWDQKNPFNKGQMGIPIKDLFNKNWCWPENQYFWKSIQKLLPNIQKIKFTGGEPFINQHVNTCLKMILKYSKNKVKIQITTNGTYIDQDQLNILKKFDTDIVVSLEGVGEINNFIRYPSNWNNIMKNLKLLEESKINFRINATFNMLNMLYITDLIEYVSNNFKNRITIIPVVKPELFNPAIAPINLKKLVIKKLNSWKKNTKIPFSNYYYDQILNRLLMASHPDAEQFNKFIKYMQELSSYRGLKIKSYLPELYETIFDPK